MLDAPHIGNILKEFVKEKRIYKSGWAKHSGVSQQAIEKYVNGSNMQMATLFKTCQVLNYNFIADIAALLPNIPHKNFNKPNPELEALKKENEKLKIEVALLKDIVGLKKV